MDSASAATSFWWGRYRWRDLVLLTFIKFLTFFFFLVFHCPSSPGWLGRCHCSRAVIGCQTTTTHNQWNPASLPVILPPPLPCVYNFLFRVRSSGSLYLGNDPVKEGNVENRMQKQCNRSLTDMSYYHLSGFPGVTMVFLTWKFSTETYSLFPFNIWKGKMQCYRIRVNEIASSDFLYCSVYVSMMVIRRNMPTLRCTNAFFTKIPVKHLPILQWYINFSDA